MFVHSGTGGSATSLSLTQYALIDKGLLDEFDCQIILTAGPGESEKAHELAAKSITKMWLCTIRIKD